MNRHSRREQRADYSACGPMPTCKRLFGQARHPGAARAARPAWPPPVAPPGTKATSAVACHITPMPITRSRYRATSPAGITLSDREGQGERARSRLIETEATSIGPNRSICAPLPGAPGAWVDNPGRYSPRSYGLRALPASSRKMSMWPLCQVIFSVRWNRTQRTVTCLLAAGLSSPSVARPRTMTFGRCRGPSCPIPASWYRLTPWRRITGISCRPGGRGRRAVRAVCWHRTPAARRRSR